jgi:hypothetical protein
MPAITKWERQIKEEEARSQQRLDSKTLGVVWPSRWCILEIPWAGENGHNSGFVISEQGFFLTALSVSRALDWRITPEGRVAWVGPDDPKLAIQSPKYPVEHVQDFEEHGVSLLKRAPTMSVMAPEEELPGDGQVFVAGVGMAGSFDLTITVAMRGHIQASSSGLVKLENRYDCTEKNATHLLGGPIFSLKPSRFVGILTDIQRDAWLEDGKASFCLLTTTSPAWLKIEAALQRYERSHLATSGKAKQKLKQL